MTICNMTIILKIRKYDNLQYDNYFEKIVIFEFQNMTTKKNLCPPPTSRNFLSLAICMKDQLAISIEVGSKFNQNPPPQVFFCHIFKFKYDNFFEIIVILQIVIFQYVQNYCHITDCHISKYFQKIVIFRLSYFKYDNFKIHLENVKWKVLKKV